MSKELRKTAVAMLIIGVVAALIVVFVVIAEDANVFLGIGIAAGIFIIASLIYDLLKGFAELIDNTAQQAQYSKEILAELRKENGEFAVANGTPCENQERKETDSTCDDETIACPVCGKIQKRSRTVCWDCGVKFEKTEQK